MLPVPISKSRFAIIFSVRNSRVRKTKYMLIDNLRNLNYYQVFLIKILLNLIRVLLTCIYIYKSLFQGASTVIAHSKNSLRNLKSEHSLQPLVLKINPYLCYAWMNVITGIYTCFLST